jgi:PAS domain S-box-containing protein
MPSKQADGVHAREKTGPAATFVIGPRGVIEDVDDTACELLGYSRDDLLGMHGSELIPPERRPATAASIDRMRRGEIQVREGRVLRRDGVVVDVEVNGSPLPDGRIALRLRKH